MKRIIAILSLLTSLPLLAADSTIANLPTNTVAQADKMVWELPGLSDYGITYANFTNQILQGIGGSGVSLSGTNTWTAPNTFTNLSISPSNSIYFSNGIIVITRRAGANITTISEEVVGGNGVAGNLNIFTDVGSGKNVSVNGSTLGNNFITSPQFYMDTSVSTSAKGDGAGNLAMTASKATFSGSLVSSNGVINYGTGWAGTTNATAPVNAVTPVAWKNYTNVTGGVFKEPLYQ